MLLVNHANVWNTCLRILRSRGFVISVEGRVTEDLCYPTDAGWTAEKDGAVFRADNPIELLGLVAIHDHIKPKEDKPYWWVVDGPDVWDEVMAEAFDNDIDAVEEMRPDGYRRFNELRDAADRAAESDEFDQALRLYQDAFDLLPEPRERWKWGTALLACIGNGLRRQGNFGEARSRFEAAQHFPGGREDPRILFGIGACLVEIGGQDAAAVEALRRAYALKGDAIFWGDDAKYRQFLEQRGGTDERGTR